MAAVAQDATPATTTPYPTGDIIMGSPDAKVEILEYASLTCSHCAAFHNNTLPTLKKEYIDTGKVRLIVREFPFDRLGLGGAMLARCGGEDRFHAITKVLYRDQAEWSRAEKPFEALRGIAKMSGISSKEYEACMADKVLAEAVIARRIEGQKEYNVAATPTFVIDGNVHPGALPIEEFRTILDPLLD
jgi:protein-disulfide isomerase